MNYFRVRVDGTDIYDLTQRDKLLINPIVRPSIDEAGSFDFTMDEEHGAYGSIIPYGSDIEVLEDEETIFFGRALPPTTNIYGQTTYHCEGAVAFLNDVIIPPLEKYVRDFASGEGETQTAEEGEEIKKQRVMYMSEYIQYVFERYNAFQTKASRKLVLGSLDLEANPAMPYDSDFKSALEILRTEILPYTGGYLVATKDYGGTITISIKRSFGNSSQTIAAGVNLLDFAQTEQGFYTGVMARGGKAYDDYEDIEQPVQTDEPVTMAQSYISRYGLICAFREWPECTTQAELTARCNSFLSSQQFRNRSFDVSALDLHITNRAYDMLNIGAEIIFRNPLDDGAPVSMMVTNVEVRLDTGEKRVQLGHRDRNKITQYWGSRTAAKAKVDQQVREGSLIPVSSEAVYKALQNTGDLWVHKIDGVVQERGTVDFVNFTS